MAASRREKSFLHLCNSVRINVTSTVIHTFGVVLDSITLGGETSGRLETNAGTLDCSKDR
jgi:hypothetical protein